MHKPVGLPGLASLLYMVTVDRISGTDASVVLRRQIQVLKTLQGQNRGMVFKQKLEKQSRNASNKICKMKNSGLILHHNPLDVFSHLIRVIRVDPSHLEHVADLLCQADTSSTIGRDVDAWNTLRSG